MAVKICAACDARNTEPGECLVCRAPLGNLGVALSTAFGTAALLGLAWVGLAWTTGLAVPYLALAFGMIVSLVMVKRSWGRGLRYQAVASAATVVGLVVANATICQLFWHELVPDWPADEPAPGLAQLVPELLNWDPITLLCATLGVIGGCWVWRMGDVDSD